jgi:hypothetical protein
VNARVSFAPLFAFFIVGWMAMGHAPTLADDGEYRPPRPAEQTPDQPAPAAPKTDAELVRKEMTVGAYYMDRKNFTGAINRFKLVVTKYKSFPQVDEALFHLTECYLSLGIVQEAQTAAAILDRKYPDSPWRSKALDLLKAQGLGPAESEKSWISRAFKPPVPPAQMEQRTDAGGDRYASSSR